MDWGNLGPARPPKNTNCFPPQRFGPPPWHCACSPPQNFVPGPHPFPSPQVNLHSPQLRRANPPLPQHFARTPQQFVLPPQQTASREVQGGHQPPQVQNPNPLPPQHFARTPQQFVLPPQQTASREVQGGHQPPQVQNPNPLPPQHFARTPQSVPPQQSAVPEVQADHHVPEQFVPPRQQTALPEMQRDHQPPQVHNPSPLPPQHSASIPQSVPTQQCPIPEIQRYHPVLQQVYPNLPSKRQQQTALGEPEEKKQDSNCKRSAIWTVGGSQCYVYQPEPTIDPFKHSKSLRHQQPENPQRKRGDDDHSNELPDDDQDDEDVSDLDEEREHDDKADREERAYQELLPKVNQLITELGVTEKWTLDREERKCMVCTFPVWLKGWPALLQHAESFKKRKPTQHRAYFRALTEQLKPGFKIADDVNFQGKAVLMESGKATEEVMLWPPVVIIDNLKEKENLDRYVPKLKPSDVQKTIRFSNRGRPSLKRMLVVFPASEVGHLNSELLVDRLAKLVAPDFATTLHESPQGQSPPFPPPPQHVQHRQGFDPGGNGQGAGSKGCRPPGCVNAPHGTQKQRQSQEWSMAQKQQQQLPRGFLAQEADMQVMDPQRRLVKWSVENKREILKCVLKKSREEHALGKAKVKAKLVEVDHIAESHQQFKSRKTVLSQQLRDAEMALQLQKDREDEIAKKHAEQLQIMDDKFKEEIGKLEIERVEREGKIRQLLEENEKQLEKERVERSKEVNFLVTHLELVNEELRNQKAQKALEKEREIARKRGEINKEIKRREAKFNEEGRILERNLIEEQESEKIKFLEEYNKLRQDFLDEWVAKQAALKEKAEKAKQEKELLLKLAESREAAAKEEQGLAECSVCFADFDDSTKRALIQPCGHARTCLPCAVEIFGKSKLCPICRVKISLKPKAVPTKLFM